MYINSCLLVQSFVQLQIAVFKFHLCVDWFSFRLILPLHNHSNSRVGSTAVSRELNRLWQKKHVVHVLASLYSLYLATILNYDVLSNVISLSIVCPRMYHMRWFSSKENIAITSPKRKASCRSQSLVTIPLLLCTWLGLPVTWARSPFEVMEKNHMISWSCICIQYAFVCHMAICIYMYIYIVLPFVGLVIYQQCRPRPAETQRQIVVLGQKD
jgi:hypothetical protein